MSDLRRRLYVNDGVGFGVFAILFVYRLARHDMWRDELQAWMIARASSTPLALFDHLRYEGHPGLWHLILWPLARLTGDPVAMQILQAGLGLLLLAMVWFRSPFSVAEKIGLCLGYFFAFEYLVISRSYGLGVALTFTFLVLRRHIESRRWLGWAILGLVANTHFFFALSAIALGAVWLWSERRSARVHATGIGLFAVLLAIAAVTASRPDIMQPGPWGSDLSGWRFTVALATISRAFIPLSSPWSWDYRDPGLPTGWNLACLPLLLAMIACYFRPQRFGLGVFMALAISLTVFFWVRYGNALRHVGALFVFFVALTWFYRDRGKPLGPSWIFMVLLVFNAYGGGKTIIAGGKPLSMARVTAQWIDDHGLGEQCWIGLPDFAASSVGAYLGRALYYPECNCRGTYIRWGARSFVYLADSPKSGWGQYAESLKALMRENDLRQCHLVTIWPVDPAGEPELDGLRFDPIASFAGGAEKMEHAYYLFNVTRP